MFGFTEKAESKKDYLNLNEIYKFTSDNTQSIRISVIITIVKTIKKNVNIPVILFPSNLTGVSKHADAMWFLSLLNSSNPYFISGIQALAAPMVKKIGIESIPLGYIIIGDGSTAAYERRGEVAVFHSTEFRLWSEGSRSGCTP